jgi:hypothetical protein
MLEKSSAHGQILFALRDRRGKRTGPQNLSEVRDRKPARIRILQSVR